MHRRTSFPKLNREDASRPEGFRAVAAFSLVELLTALSIVAVLTSATVGVTRGIDQRMRSQRALTELTLLRQAIESVRSESGEYPLTGSCLNLVATDEGVRLETAEAKLFNVLAGRLNSRLLPTTGRPRVDLTRFGLAPGAPLPVPGGGEEIANAFIDPWGRPYVYRYRATSASPWDGATFLLYSLGPDGEEDPPVNGFLDTNSARNLDNVTG